MGKVFEFFTALLAKISAFASWILLLVKRMFLDAWNIFTDVLCWGFDAILGIAVGAISAISVPFDPQTYYSMIPADTANMLGVIGVTQSLTIVVAALVIRFTLQTIPLVRWGS